MESKSNKIRLLFKKVFKKTKHHCKQRYPASNSKVAYFVFEVQHLFLIDISIAEPVSDINVSSFLLLKTPPQAGSKWHTGSFKAFLPFTL